MNKIPAFVFTLFIYANLHAQIAGPKILTDTGLHKLNVFVGTWKSQNNPDDGTSAVYSCKWSDNGNFLVCDQAVTSAGKKTNNLAIYSYDVENKHYNLSLVGIPGMEPFSIPVFSEGDTLSYPGEYMDNGQKVYNRTLNIFSSPSSYQFKIQSSKDGKQWTTSMEGKSVKISG